MIILSDFQGCVKFLISSVEKNIKLQ